MNSLHPSNDLKDNLPYLILEIVPSDLGPKARLVIVEDSYYLSDVGTTEDGQSIVDSASSVDYPQTTVGPRSISESTQEDQNPKYPRDLEDTETMEDFRIRLTDAIQQMMFVSGETAEPSVETTTLIEEIVRQQVIEMVVILPHVNPQKHLVPLLTWS
jgi:hypothetical protein